MHNTSKKSFGGDDTSRCEGLSRNSFREERERCIATHHDSHVGENGVTMSHLMARENSFYAAAKKSIMQIASIGKKLIGVKRLQ
jgi:hypothetical protein